MWVKQWASRGQILGQEKRQNMLKKIIWAATTKSAAKMTEIIRNASPLLKTHSPRCGINKIGEKGVEELPLLLLSFAYDGNEIR